MRFPYQEGQLEMQLTRMIGPDSEPIVDRDGVIRTDDHNRPLHRVRILANEPDRDFDTPVSLKIRTLPTLDIPRGTMVQPAGDATVTPWVDDRTHRIAYSITADTIVPVQALIGRHQESADA